jgi:hypothetical protein
MGWSRPQVRRQLLFGLFRFVCFKTCFVVLGQHTAARKPERDRHRGQSGQGHLQVTFFRYCFYNILSVFASENSR